MSENKAKVFVSYSHKDKKWKDMLLSQLKVLEKENGISIWSDDQIDVGDDWFQKIQDAIEQATIGIFLVSTDFLNSDFIGKEEIPGLLEKRAKEGMWLIPILVRPCLFESIAWLNSLDIFPEAKPLSRKKKDIQEELFCDIAREIFNRLEAAKESKEPLPLPQKTASKWEKPIKIDIDRLPVTGAELFGRNDELNELNEFWKSEDTNVASFVAWGGVGKSTLITKWLQYMREDNYREAKKVFGWSFYSQGTNEKVTSADRFIREALEWFGDEKPDEGSAWDKGKRLGKLIGQEKNLLVLDGLEPLQSGLEIEKGKIKDPALEMLLKQLAKKNEGLCLITTREELPNMEKFGDAFQEIELDQISKEAGRALLRVQGVRGSDEAIETVVEGFGKHALAINLLGSYLHEIPNHPISEAHKIKDIDVDDERSRHPRRVIEAWEERLGESAELNILRIMGLFDRPADEGAIRTLRKKPAIKYLTDHIGRKDKFTKALKKLRDLNLIAKESHVDLGTLDSHPIVRQHFAEQLENDFQETWKEANERLYKYYKSVPKEFPDTLEEMQPLVFAVAHGCAAEKYQEAFDKVYYKRILRGDNFFTSKKLGAIGADLAVLAQFFEKKWDKPVSNLHDSSINFILNLVGFRLKSLGRIKEAIQPSKIGLYNREYLKFWKGASIDASNISEIYLALGDIKSSANFAENAIEFSEKSEDEYEKVLTRTVLANAIFQSRKINQAEKLFIEAEKMHREGEEPEYPWLYSVRGFNYCSLLLEKKRIQEVIQRAEYALKISIRNNQLLSIGLDFLTLGKANFMKALENKITNFNQINELFNQAVDGLRNSGQLQFLPYGLLARAELYRVQKKWDEAQEDLEEVFELSISSEMRLFECDAHLEQVRLYLAQERDEEAKPHVDKARKLIEDTGYHRRDSALEELKGQIK